MMNVIRLRKQFGFLIVAAVMLNGVASTRVWADGQHTTMRTGADSLISVVRQTTERFKDVNVARAEG